MKQFKCSMSKKKESVAKKREGLSPAIQSRIAAKRRKRETLEKLKALDKWLKPNNNLFTPYDSFADYFEAQQGTPNLVAWFCPVLKGIGKETHKKALDIAQKALADYDDYIEVHDDEDWDNEDGTGYSGFCLSLKPAFYELSLDDMKELIELIDEDVAQWKDVM